jgi:hypothetical protein
MKNSSIMSCHILPCYALPYLRVMWVAVILHANIDDKRSRHVLLCPGLEQLIIVLISAVVVERCIKLTILVSWENQILLPIPFNPVFFPQPSASPSPHCPPSEKYIPPPKRKLSVSFSRGGFERWWDKIGACGGVGRVFRIS